MSNQLAELEAKIRGLVIEQIALLMKTYNVQPRELASAILKNPSLRKVAVDTVEPTPVAKTRKKRKASPLKGVKKPAKYQDPKTGATWSGFGHAPAWIAKARNRDRFLIPQDVTGLQADPNYDLAA